VDPAARVAGEQSEREADDEGREDADRHDLERRARTDEDSGEDVPTDRIRPHQMPEAEPHDVERGVVQGDLPGRVRIGQMAEPQAEPARLDGGEVPGSKGSQVQADELVEGTDS